MSNFNENLHFVRCENCKTVVHITKKPKMCECGGVLASITGDEGYVATGNSIAFTVPEAAFDGGEATAFIGQITTVGKIPFGQKQITDNRKIRGVTTE